MYELKEVSLEEKLEILERHGSGWVKDFNKKICCIHCDNEFILNEFKVILEKPTNEEWIVCKYFPECNGTMIDFVSAKK